MTNRQGPSRSRAHAAAAPRAALRPTPIALLALMAVALAAGVARSAGAADSPATPAAAATAAPAAAASAPTTAATLPGAVAPSSAAPASPAADAPPGTAATPGAAPGSPAADASAATGAPPAPSEIEAARQAAVAAGVTIVDLKVGRGEPVRAGATARVHYTGWLHDAAAPGGKGKKFDSSRDRRQPFEFPLGQQRVIRGWDLGVAGMQRGGRRRLVIPDTLAYGARGAGAGLIPPHATLVFDVELIDFAPP